MQVLVAGKEAQEVFATGGANSLAGHSIIITTGSINHSLINQSIIHQLIIIITGSLIHQLITITNICQVIQMTSRFKKLTPVPGSGEEVSSAEIALGNDLHYKQLVPQVVLVLVKG